MVYLVNGKTDPTKLQSLIRRNNSTTPTYRNPPTPQLFERIVEFCGVLIFWFVLYQDKMNVKLYLYNTVHERLLRFARNDSNREVMSL
jgi:hypothetical protein